MKKTMYALLLTTVSFMPKIQPMNNTIHPSDLSYFSHQNIEEMTINDNGTSKCYRSFSDSNNKTHWVRKIGTIISITEQEELRKSEQPNPIKHKRVRTRAEVPNNSSVEQQEIPKYRQYNAQYQKNIETNTNKRKNNTKTTKNSKRKKKK